MAMKGLKKTLAMGSFAVVSALGAVETKPEPEQLDQVEAIQKFRDIFSSRIINKTGEDGFLYMFQNQLKTMAQTQIGLGVLKDLPTGVNYAIAEAPPHRQSAGFWDGENCTIYDDILLSPNCSSATLIAHETRHAIQSCRYDKDYEQMPTEQQIIYNKMIEVETRLQDVLMKEELYNQNAIGSHEYEFATADWKDYRRIKANLLKENPNLSSERLERLARTQFVTDTWQGNYQKDLYEQRDGQRTFKEWLQTYNSQALQASNRRCRMIRPLPDMTVDENLVKRHHAIMQEFIGRMGIDVPPDYFDNLSQDKSLNVIRSPQVLRAWGKHFDSDLKLIVMPRDDFVKVGGIAVAKDNSTVMFSPEKRKVFEKEIQAISLANQANGAVR